MPPGICPLQTDFQNIARDARSLRQSLRRLHRKRIICRRCSQSASCRFWQDFNAQIDAAIRDVLSEWKLL